ncbi:MAG: glycosyltransferase family 4 protein [Deltaproteobacteria bacterium]|nr:glycosyltransferase family 4 protein [Deltaproteobacteria bacterium]
MKVWMIQNVIAPYRIKLFERMAAEPGVNFEVILLARKMKNLPHWKVDFQQLPFKAKVIPGANIQIGYERILCLNPGLLLRMFLERPDVVICSGFSFATIGAFVYRLLGGGRYVIWWEGTEFTEGTRSRLRVTVRWLLIRFASALVDAGKLSKQYLRSLLPSNSDIPFFTSYNCIESSRFRPDPLRSEELTSLREKFPGRTILCVGQLVERKGVLKLLEVYGKLPEETKKDVGLVFVGKGPLEGEIRSYCKQHELNNVHLEGLVAYDRIPLYYWMSDLFVILSTEDPNPLVIFEALTAGLPVVCSNRLGNAVDFVNNGENGFVVDPLHADQIAVRIIEILGWSTSQRERSAAVSAGLVAKANYDDAAAAFIDASRTAMARR